jgi:hypothetical protein
VPEDLAASFGNPFALRRIFTEMADVRHQLITAHTYRASYGRERHLNAVFRKRTDPCSSMGIVAVDESTVDIEEDGAYHPVPSLSGVRFSARSAADASTS